MPTLGVWLFFLMGNVTHISVLSVSDIIVKGIKKKSRMKKKTRWWEKHTFTSPILLLRKGRSLWQNAKKGSSF